MSEKTFIKSCKSAIVGDDMSLVRSIFIILWGVFVIAAANRGGGPLLSHIALTLGTAAAVLLVLARRFVPQWRSTRFTLRFMWLHGVYAVFCALVGISILVGFTPEYGFSEFLLFINTGMLIFLLSGLPIEEGDTRFFIAGNLSIAVVITLIGFGFYVYNPIARVAGTFLYPTEPQNAAFNTFANVLLLIIPSAVWYSVQFFTKKIYSYGVIIMTGIVLAGLVLTFSRAAYLSLILSFIACILLIVMLPQRNKKGHTLLIILRLLGVILVSAIIFAAAQLSRSILYETTSLKDKLLFESDEGASSALERLDYWSASIKLIAERPLFGRGVLSFRYIYPAYQSKFGINEDHPHNIFLKIGVENGLPAALLFGVFLIGILIYSLRFSYYKFYHPAFFLMLGVLAATLHNMIDFNFVVSNYLLWALSIGIFLSSARELQHFDIKGGGALLVIVCLLALGTTIFALHEGYYNRDLQAARIFVETGDLDAAVPHLERAKKLIFKRDFYKIYSDYFRSRFVVTGEEKWLLAEQWWLPDTIAVYAPTIIDADYSQRYGENLLALATLRKDTIAELLNAGAYLCNALRQDPQNNLRHYYFYLQWLQKRSQIFKMQLSNESLNEEIEACGGRNLDVLLNEYNEILKRNEHFTIVTENPYYASLIYEILAKNEEKKAFDAQWIFQLAQYKLRFGFSEIP